MMMMMELAGMAATKDGIQHNNSKRHGMRATCSHIIHLVDLFSF